MGTSNHVSSFSITRTSTVLPARNEGSPGVIVASIAIFFAIGSTRESIVLITHFFSTVPFPIRIVTSCPREKRLIYGSGTKKRVFIASIVARTKIVSPAPIICPTSTFFSTIVPAKGLRISACAFSNSATCFSHTACTFCVAIFANSSIFSSCSAVICARVSSYCCCSVARFSSV